MHTKSGMLGFSGINRSMASYLQGSKDDENNSDEKDDKSSWMKNAMNLDPKDMEQQEEESSPSPKTTTPLQSGISGFTVDPELGFVCVFAPEENPSDQFIYAIVSPTDDDKLSSPEALSLVQLSGGLDLGAAVFPPETLAKIVGNEMILNQVEDIDDDDDNDDREIEELVEELRSKVTLLGVTASPNERYLPPSPSADGTDDNGTKIIESTPERNVQIEEASPKILPAIQNLPGLTTVTLEHISQAMQIHADAKGNLGRDAFSELLDTLRTGRNGSGDGSNGRNRLEDQRIKMSITASIELSNDNDGEDSLKLVEVDHVPIFQAVALALRYKVTVSVSEDCFKLDNDDEGSANAEHGESVSVRERFPAFKPVQELAKDARVMDGFISTMFFKQAAPDNEDKA